MKVAKIITWLGLLAMSLGLLNGFINGNFFSDGKELLANPWGIMSMIDLYVGFTLFSMWIFYREKSLLASVIWTLFMMILGFFTACLYILINLYGAKGDWDKLLKGKNSN